MLAGGRLRLSQRPEAAAQGDHILLMGGPAAHIHVKIDISQILDALDELSPVVCAVGAAFDFHAGRISQAPSWMQQRGLEWTYRIAQEPRRLLPRYLYYNPRFMLALGGQLARERARRLTG